MNLHDIHDYMDADDNEFATKAINHAIATASGQGGGTVYVPPGTYSIGTIQLQSHVTLYLEAGAQLKANAEIAEFEHGAIIYGENVEHISICGPGTIDGHYEKYTHLFRDGRYWPFFKHDKYGESIPFENITQYEWQDRPRQLLLKDCRHITLRDFTLQNSPFWTLHLEDCRYGRIHGISILAI